MQGADHDVIAYALQFLATSTSLLAAHVIGLKDARGYVVALVAQVFWLLLTFYSGLWGFLPGDVAFAVIFVRNWLKWRRDGHST